MELYTFPHFSGGDDIERQRASCPDQVCIDLFDFLLYNVVLTKAVELKESYSPIVFVIQAINKTDQMHIIFLLAHLNCGFLKGR